MFSSTLVCTQCGWLTIGGEEDIVRRLRALGLFRRAPHPPIELVSELLKTNAHRLTCDACHQPGLAIIAHGDAGSLEIHSSVILAESEDDGDWQQAVICQVCREPISPDRLEVFPKAKRCAKCQDLSDRGAEPITPEYCPKCGAIVELRVSRGGGITRYKRFCTGQPSCRL
jgi:Zn finger protein HypA/HybF involved in hydrogenase expression